MATKVRMRETGDVYLLLGVGYGTYKASHASTLLGGTTENEGEVALVAVCTREGKIGWVASDEVVVDEIDGQTPSRLLSDN